MPAKKSAKTGPTKKTRYTRRKELKAARKAEEAARKAEEAARKAEEARIELSLKLLRFKQRKNIKRQKTLQLLKKYLVVTIYNGRRRLLLTQLMVLLVINTLDIMM